MSAQADEQRPQLRVVGGGEPSDDELAALVAALSVVRRRARAAASKAQSAWADRSAGLRRPLSPGPDQWRRAARRS